jgi:hypothetical protein
MSRTKSSTRTEDASEIESYTNPVRLSVATRETRHDNEVNAEAGPSTSNPSQPRPLDERERLLKARKANEVVRKKGEKWADKLMEETVDKATFKKAVSVAHPPPSP